MLAWFNKILCMQAFIAADGHPRKFLRTKRMYQWNPKIFGHYGSNLTHHTFSASTQNILATKRGYSQMVIIAGIML